MTRPADIVADYHERTKHHFQRYARSLGYLDWATQPDPFRRYECAPLVPLRFRRDDARPAFDDLFTPGAVEAESVTVESISSLFELSLGLSAWKEFQGSRWALRINPSSGNLHPTEGYLVIGSLNGLGECGGVYHYAPMEHALERRAEFDASLWTKMVDSFPKGSFLVGLTSIHWREAWKYGERAYRYCQHDVGHALATVSISAAVLGWRSEMLDAIGDAEIALLLGLDRNADFADAEREHPDLLVAVVPQSSEPRTSVRAEAGVSATVAGQMNRITEAARWYGRANQLSEDHVNWEIIDEVAEACVRQSDGALRAWSGSDTTDGNGNEREGIRSLPRAARIDPTTVDPPLAPNRAAVSAARLIRQRRSAVAFDGHTSITAEQFYFMLDRTLPRFDRVPWNTLGPPACVHLGLFVHLVEGVPPGLYCLVRSPAQTDSLRSAMSASFAWEKPPSCPEGLPLFLLQRGDARRVSTQVSCGQEIAGESAFSLGMIAEFERPLREYGAWFYRRLFWECGVIGQVLYLEAEAASVRGTGIGCFFDDPVHDVLGLTGRAYQSLYHFTVGGPIEDLRLTTLPPYPRELVANRAAASDDIAHR